MTLMPDYWQEDKEESLDSAQDLNLLSGLAVLYVFKVMDET